MKVEFICKACGYHSTIAVNSARNIERIAKSKKPVVKENKVDSDCAEKTVN